MELLDVFDLSHSYHLRPANSKGQIIVLVVYYMMQFLIKLTVNWPFLLIWFVKMVALTLGHINVSLQNQYKFDLQFPRYMQN